MTNLKYFSLFGAALIWFMPLFGQKNLSLSDAIQTGLQNNFQIQIAEKQIEITKNNNNYYQAGRYPTVNFLLNSGNGFTAINNPTSFLDGAQLTSLGLTPTVDLQWVLFDGYKVRINKKRLEQLEMQTLGNKEIIIESTVQAIILAYYRAVIEQEKLDILQELLQLSSDRYAYERVKQELGTGSSFNVFQTKDAYLSDSINLKIQQRLAATAQRNLNLAIGMEDTQQLYNLTDSLVFAPQTFDVTALEQKMFDQNRNLRNQFLNLQLLKTETEFQQSNRYPRIAVNTGANYALSQNFLGDLSAGGNTFQYYLNFSLTFNLYDAGRTKRAIQNALTNEAASELNIADQKRILKGQLLEATATYTDLADLIELHQTRMANALENLKVAETRFKSGVISSFDYRNVQLAYLRAATARLETIFNLKTIETDILRLTGGIIN